MLGFFKAVFSMPGPIVVWVMFLFSVNLIPALIFIETLEARVVLGGLVAGAILQTWIFSKKGFVRLLGLGHVLWLPMVVWLGYRVPLADPGSLFAYALIAIVIVNSLSLAIDTIDVIRYVRGNRKPTLSA
jgi:hypothetical protein